MGTVAVDRAFEMLWAMFLLGALTVASSVVFVGQLLQTIENVARRAL